MSQMLLKKYDCGGGRAPGQLYMHNPRKNKPIRQQIVQECELV
jgi:hypothetical protein